MGAHSYQELDVWKKSVDLSVRVYEFCKQLPKTEQFALANQMQRAAVSIPSNIAEGQKRFSSKDTTHFCSIALGSVAELEMQFIIAHRVYKLEVDNFLNECAILSRMLHALIKSLRVNSD